MSNTHIEALSATAEGIVTFADDNRIVVEPYPAQQGSRAVKTRVSKPADVMESFFMNHIQRSLYRRLMYGFKEYSPEQIKSMSAEILKKIESDHKTAQRLLHIMKVKKHFRSEFKMLKAIFGYKITNHQWYWMMLDTELPKKVTLRSLNISTPEICNEFIKNHLLPQDFYSLKPANITLK